LSGHTMSYGRKETRRTRSISITETNGQEQLCSPKNDKDLHENSLVQSTPVFKLLVVILFTLNLKGFYGFHVLSVVYYTAE
jgi:hypothetical protein